MPFFADIMGGFDTCGEASLIAMHDSLKLALTAALAIFFASWTFAFRRWLKGQSVVARRPRKAVPWGLLDIVLTVVALIAVISIAITTLSVLLGFSGQLRIDELSLPQRAMLILVESLSSLAVMFVSMTILFLRHRVTWTDIGWDGRKLWEDTKLGVGAFLMLAPVVYAIQIVLTQWFESKHPLMELLKEQADPSMLAISTFAAVVVAPLTEEYFFRVLLQGWLEKVAAQWQRDKANPPQDVSSNYADPAVSLNDEPSSPPLPPYAGPPYAGPPDSPTPPGSLYTPPLAQSEGGFYTPYTPPLTASENAADPGKLSCSSGNPAIWPILFSSLVFSLLHLSHGPDWIPLFFLALGLGYLYRQTHRIWPCIVVHFLLNAFSMTLFLIQVLGNR